MDFTRRSLIRKVSVPLPLLISGCQIRSDDSTSNHGDTEGRSTSTEYRSTSSVSHLDDYCIKSQFEGYTGITPMSPPSFTGDISEANAETFAKKYETYYQRYEALYETGAPTPESENEPAHGIPNVDLQRRSTSITQRSTRSYVVSLESVLHREVHENGQFVEVGRRDVKYYLDDETIVRSESRQQSIEPPDPLEGGTVMTC